jgi:hypothetical protein
MASIADYKNWLRGKAQVALDFREIPTSPKPEPEVVFDRESGVRILSRPSRVRRFM